MIRQLLQKLEREKLFLASAESLTGGLFAASLTSIAGVSSIYAGGLVTYTNEAKIRLGVNKDTIEKFGAISTECSRELAKATLEKFGADVAISFTGNAGPSASEGKTIGLVFISIAVKNQLFNYQLKLDGDRSMIREQCVNFGIKTLYKVLMQVYPEADLDEPLGESNVPLDIPSLATNEEDLK